MEATAQDAHPSPVQRLFPSAPRTLTSSPSTLRKRRLQDVPDASAPAVPAPGPGRTTKGDGHARLPGAGPPQAGRTPGTGSSGAARIFAQLRRARDTRRDAQRPLQRNALRSQLSQAATRAASQKPTEVASLPDSSAGTAVSGPQISRHRVSPAPRATPPRVGWEGSAESVPDAFCLLRSGDTGSQRGRTEILSGLRFSFSPFSIA